MAKKTSFKDKDVAELKKLLVEKREELRQVRFSGAGARVKDTNHAAKIRKDIARLMTEMATKAKAA